jgi:cytochrome c oxidase subunit IV
VGVCIYFLLFGVILKNIDIMAAHAENLTPEEIRKKNVNRVLVVTGILAGITAVEFLLAFTMSAGMGRNIIFILLTIAKAFYIVADFMHLRHEVKTLILAIILPAAFVVWLIVALLAEGGNMYTPRIE